jgi:membrane-anchored glycerophosphoryl diester phosphodiesterase (GDPDase)
LFGFVALVVVGVVLALSAPALVLERIGPWQAAKRSWTLTRRSFWRCFGVLLLAQIVAGVISFGILVPFVIVNAKSFTALATGTSSSGQSLLLVAGRLLSSVVTAPFRGAVVAVLYVDRRIRAEALDIALAAQLYDETAR